MLNNGVRGQTIYLFLATADSERLSSLINSKPLTADQQEKIHAAFLCSRDSSKNNVVHQHYTDSLIAMHVYMSSSSRFLVIIRELDPSRSKWKRAAIKLCRRMPCLQCIIHAERQEDCVWERKTGIERKDTHLCFSIPEIPSCTCWWNQIRENCKAPVKAKKVINFRVKAQTQFQTPLSMLRPRPTIIVAGVSHYLHSHLPVSVSKSTSKSN